MDSAEDGMRMSDWLSNSHISELSIYLLMYIDYRRHPHSIQPHLSIDPQIRPVCKVCTVTNSKAGTKRMPSLSPSIPIHPHPPTSSRSQDPPCLPTHLHLHLPPKPALNPSPTLLLGLQSQGAPCTPEYHTLFQHQSAGTQPALNRAGKTSWAWGALQASRMPGLFPLCLPLERVLL